MKERAILFSGPMVRAILEGRKTQTRRVMRHQPQFNADRNQWEYQSPRCNASWSGSRPLACGKLITQDDCPYGFRGDRLWVRETWGLSAYSDDTDWLSESIVGQSQDLTTSWRLRYEADYEGPTSRGEYPHWRPSIHMPRWASRITLEVTDVRVERVQDISDDDAELEGVTMERGIVGCHCNGGEHTEVMGDLYFSGVGGDGFEFAGQAYKHLWESINGPGSWAANPWVWVVEFKRVTP